MRKGYLTPELSNFLMLHFRDMSDKELAEEMTKKVELQIKERSEKIKAVLPMVTHAGTRTNLLKELRKYENFSGITIGCVRNWARRIGCNGKSRIHVAVMNREKAKISNDKLWLSKAQTIEQFWPFLDTMCAKEVRFVMISSQGQLNSYRSMMSAFNKENGRSKGLTITGFYNKELKIFRLEAIRNYSNY